MIIATHNLEDLEHVDDPLPHHLAGLQYTSSGYGRKIPTRTKVRLPGSKVWRRVWCCQYSNMGTCYVVSYGHWIVIR